MVQVFVDVVSDANLVTFKGILLIMPAVILSFVAFMCTLLFRRSRSSNAVPFIGTFSSIFGFFTGAAGLALVIVTFWKGLATLEHRIEGLSHQWGPAIYLVGIGSGCILIALVCFVITLFTSSESHKRETFHLYDYDLNNNNNITANTAAAYDTTTHLNSPKKHDSYNDYSNAVTTPTAQHYPSYHQHQQQPYQHQNAYQQQNTYQQQNNYGGGNYY